MSLNFEQLLIVLILHLNRWGTDIKKQTKGTSKSPLFIDKATRFARAYANMC